MKLAYLPAYGGVLKPFVGGSIQAYAGEMTVELARRKITLRSLFAPDFSPNLLGRDNFFRVFHVCFDELNHEIELRYRRKQRR